MIEQGEGKWKELARQEGLQFRAAAVVLGIGTVFLVGLVWWLMREKPGYVIEMDERQNTKTTWVEFHDGTGNARFKFPDREGNYTPKTVEFDLESKRWVYTDTKEFVNQIAVPVEK